MVFEEILWQQRRTEEVGGGVPADEGGAEGVSDRRLFFDENPRQIRRDIYNMLR
jgi:hypothetical protein